MKKNKFLNKVLRKKRVRKKIAGTPDRVRLSVFRGLRRTYIQLIDDSHGVTVASAYERELSPEYQKGTKADRARALGILIAKKAKSVGVTAVVFDRGGNAYHGRVRAVAEGAREGGLVF